VWWNSFVATLTSDSLDADYRVEHLHFES